MEFGNKCLRHPILRPIRWWALSGPLQSELLIAHTPDVLASSAHNLSALLRQNVDLGLSFLAGRLDFLLRLVALRLIGLRLIGLVLRLIGLRRFINKLLFVNDSKTISLLKVMKIDGPRIKIRQFFTKLMVESQPGKSTR